MASRRTPQTTTTATTTDSYNYNCRIDNKSHLTAEIKGGMPRGRLGSGLGASCFSEMILGKMLFKAYICKIEIKIGASKMSSSI